MYVSFEKFAESGISELSADEYAKLAPMADLVIDHWTLDRVGAAVRGGEELPPSVTAIYCAIIEALPNILSNSKPGKGGLVTSFSNGIDSYSFDVTSTVEEQLESSLGWMVDLLPVEWISACVTFEGGNRYAR